MILKLPEDNPHHRYDRDPIFFFGTVTLRGFPAIIFLWLARIWVFCHRNKLRDDPVAFALMPRLIPINLGILTPRRESKAAPSLPALASDAGH
jgi:hypothetical protein